MFLEPRLIDASILELRQSCKISFHVRDYMLFSSSISIKGPRHCVNPFLEESSDNCHPLFPILSFTVIFTQYGILLGTTVLCGFEPSHSRGRFFYKLFPHRIKGHARRT